MAARVERITVPELEQFIVTNVQLTGRELGAGAYGSVEEVEILGATVAAKKLHENLIKWGQPQQVEKWKRDFVEECKLMSQLCHPHIVQFLGVCYLPEAPLPVLLMEKLLTSLDNLLETTPNIPIHLKVHFLIGISRGLVYLHGHTPPIAHRDLSARNILVDNDLNAKIADLGVSKMVNIQPGQLAATMTHRPGNILYMPPEANQEERARYNTSIDIFSLGVVSLFILTQIFPKKLKPATYSDPATQKIVGRSEIERREEYIVPMKTSLGETHPMVKLTLDCLKFIPEARPSAVDVLRRLEEFGTTLPQNCTQTKLQLIQEIHTTVRVAAEKQAEIDQLQTRVDHLVADIGLLQAENQEQVHRLQKQVETKNKEIASLSNEMSLIRMQSLRQEKVYKEPIRISLGVRRIWKGLGANRRSVTKNDEMFYIPLLKTLQSYFDDNFFAHQINAGHASSSEFMEDYCDGKGFRTHPLFSIKRRSLQIILYYDEVEICNPLGSKVKTHKLGMFYFSLGNIHPQYRSSLSSIKLVCIVKSKILSLYGMDCVLKPIVTDIKKLEGGVQFEVTKGQFQEYFGTLAIVSADNLGSLLLGGFKESCTANRCCRHCLATRQSSKEKFIESDFVLRDKISHIQQCSEIKADDGTAKSIEYGINRNSILNELLYFHVCDGSLIPDIMHDVLEGALQYEVKLMLKKMIYEDKYFTLDFLNSRLDHLDLGYMEAKNRPTNIATKNLLAPTGLSLKQNASQMWLLGRILPILVGDRVPDDDEKWANFLLMMDIVDRLFCTQVSEDDAVYLQWLINDHHKAFVSLYPEYSFIPKLHFMAHMPRLMILFGPLVRFWTMRFEAKHSYFKRLSHSMGNFINLPYSLAMRHQQLQCYENSTGFKPSLTVGPGTVVIRDDIQSEVGQPNPTVYSVKWVIVNGVEYQKDAGVVYKMENEVPLVGQIDSIMVVNDDTVILQLHCYSTYFNPHFRVYVLETLLCEKNISICDLCLIKPVHIRTASALPGIQFCILPYHVNSI